MPRQNTVILVIGMVLSFCLGAYFGIHINNPVTSPIEKQQTGWDCTSYWKIEMDLETDPVKVCVRKASIVDETTPRINIIGWPSPVMVDTVPY